MKSKIIYRGTVDGNAQEARVYVPHKASHPLPPNFKDELRELVMEKSEKKARRTLRLWVEKYARKEDAESQAVVKVARRLLAFKKGRLKIVLRYFLLGSAEAAAKACGCTKQTVYNQLEQLGALEG